MKLENVDILKMLPSFMKEDKYNSLLATGMNNLFNKCAVNMQRIIIVGQTDILNEAELDQIAEDSGIFWYNYSGTIESKRLQIKEAPLVFKRLGTVWAVERVMNQYFENTELQEWFDYNGEPHHFKFTTKDTSILKSDIYGFLSILEKVKRKSQWLDEIILELQAQSNIYPAFGIIEESTDTYYFGVNPNEIDIVGG